MSSALVSSCFRLFSFRMCHFSKCLINFLPDFLIHPISGQTCSHLSPYALNSNSAYPDRKYFSHFIMFLSGFDHKPFSQFTGNNRIPGILSQVIFITHSITTLTPISKRVSIFCLNSRFKCLFLYF